jgi:hypothetical protein
MDPENRRDPFSILCMDSCGAWKSVSMSSLSYSLGNEIYTFKD